jgi:hypothetical protein
MQPQAFKAKLISRKGKKAGISNLIGILLAIVITLAIAGGVAAYTFGLVGSSSSNLSPMITTASATYVSSTSTVLTITVKNTGTTAFKSIDLYVDGSTTPQAITWAPTISSTAPLAAGQSMSGTISSLTWPQGAQHVLTIDVGGVSGGNSTTTQSVTVQ